MSWLADLVEEIDRHGTVVRVTVVRADGSTPREVGAAMYVSAGDVRDTIGGGALELAAVGHARAMLAATASARDSLSPLLRGEGWGEGQPGTQTLLGQGRDGGHVPTSASVAAPHPNPLPAKCGERESGRRVDRASAPDGDAVAWVRDLRDFPLGPSLGQCCGGYVRLLFEVFGARGQARLLVLAGNCDADCGLLLRPLDGGTPPYVTAHRKEHRPDWPLGVTRVVREMLSGARPRAPMLVRGPKGQSAWFIEPLARTMHRVHIYGAGHVGRAIVRVLADLPFAVTWVDTSAGRFPEPIPAHAKAEVAPDPAAFAGGAAADAFHLVLTYSHAIDLAICHSLLRRGDFRFLGLIGSATKRARFLKRLAGLGIGEARLERLVCPIGVSGIGGKEPAMIALSVAAQLVQLATATEARTPAQACRQKDAAP